MALKKKKKRSGSKGNKSELIFEKWVSYIGIKAHHRFRRSAAVTKDFAGKPKIFTFSHDGFGCLDLIAILNSQAKKELSKNFRITYDDQSDELNSLEFDTWAVQITTQSGRSQRRRKIEEIAWPESYLVHLVSHEITEDPVNRRKKQHFWKIQQYKNASWLDSIAISFDLTEIEKSWKNSKAEKE